MAKSVPSPADETIKEAATSAPQKPKEPLVQSLLTDPVDGWAARLETKRVTCEIKKPDGEVVFHAENIEAPTSWSQLSVDIAASKYMRRRGVPRDILPEGAETSVLQLIERVTECIAQAGLEQGLDGDESLCLKHELGYLLSRQIGAFNSPVWFNCGLDRYKLAGSGGNFFWDRGAGAPVRASTDYEHPQCSACFIQSVDDSLEGIFDLVKTEARLFKFGSGSGTNFSKIRGSMELLSGGGRSSGVMSFLGVLDKAAGAIKSGGTCLAPHQRVYTSRGPIPVKELADMPDGFVALSYDPPAGRYKAKRARAWIAGHKNVVRVVTDKGTFELTDDHPVKLSSGEYVLAGQLKTGASLFACSIDRAQGYLRVHLRDGRKGKERLSRLVASDVMGQDIEEMSVHHLDGDKDNNDPSNLQVMSQAEHAGKHGSDLAARGVHVFQTERFSTSGSLNGMHRSAPFWNDEAKTRAYRSRQSAILKRSNRGRVMQTMAADQKMLNTAFRVLNAGYSINTFEEYVEGRKKAIGLIPSIVKLRETITARFGSYENFVKTVSENNHRVERIEALGFMDVYDVEVECPTADDKSPRTGHNFVIWPTEDRLGSGVVVANTRRAAKMVILDMDHPDIEEFILWKMKEENKARAMIAAGYPADFNGETYQTVSGQNSNNSVRISDDFMNAVLKDGVWDTKSRTDAKIVKSYKARYLWDLVAKAAWSCADPGVQFDDNFNEWNTCPVSGRINATNPCVPGHTRILTRSGYRKIQDLVGTKVAVWNGEVWSEVSPKMTGQNQPLVRVRLSDGTFLDCTPAHEWCILDGRREVKIQASDLKPDMVLAKFDMPVVEVGDDMAHAYAHGFFCGDGHEEAGRPGHKFAALYGVKIGLCARLGVDNPSTDTHLRRVVELPADMPEKYRVPHGSSIKSRLDWLAGLLDADGTVHRNPKSDCVCIASTNLEFLREIRLMLTTMGVQAKIGVMHQAGVKEMPDGRGSVAEYECQTCYRLLLNAEDTYRLTALGLLTERLDLGRSIDAPQRDARRFVRVVGVEPLPGEHDVYCFNEPRNHTGTFEGIVTGQCSEYAFLDDSACNLASLNLTRFLNEDGVFDAKGYVHACEVFFLAQEILVEHSSYPTEKICQNSRDFRPLGLGFADLGSLLMQMGLAYDSPEGRGWAATLSSLMTAAAYRMSARMAARFGTFPGYEKNKPHVLSVLGRHHSAWKHRALMNDVLANMTKVPKELVHLVSETWEDALELAWRYGVRNAQATLLAPTGTIGYLMGCDTTGIEPCYSLVSYKKLVGGGTLRLVNRSVEKALYKLGYADTEVARMVAYVEENGTLEGSQIQEKDLPVFDCAAESSPGGRFLSTNAHLYMMAVVQPFLSGSISKTINTPNKTTVEEIQKIYMDAWLLGLKSIALYRDGSKGSQPLLASASMKEERPEGERKVEEAVSLAAKSKPEISPSVDPEAAPVLAGARGAVSGRRRLPRKRGGFTQEARVGGHKIFLRTGEYPDGSLGEIFVDMHKEGAAFRSLMNCLAMAVSRGLQYGVPLRDYVDLFTFTRFEPQGVVEGHDNVKLSTSIVDYIFRVLAIEYLGMMDFAHAVPEGARSDDETTEIYGKETQGEAPARGQIAATGDGVPAREERSGRLDRLMGDSPLCDVCGSLTVRNASCYRCPNCGNSMGCS